MSKQKCFQEVPDFEEKVKNGELNVVFLYDDSTTPKHPVGGKYNYRPYSELTDPTNKHRNLGIGFPKTVTDNIFLCVIDIDGDSSFSDDISEMEQLKEGTRQFLFDIIKQKMNEYGLKPMYVTTASNGFHIYLYVTQSTHKQHGFKKFSYPESNMITSGLINTSAFNDFPVLNKIIGKRMGQKSIEIFTQGSYVVAPGSVINGNKYTVLPDGAQTFEEISVYGQKPIQDFIQDILMESYFSINVEQTTPIYETQQEKHDLLPRNVRSIGDLIIKAWPLIDGQKQEATLALGGFLYKMNVSVKSIMEIGNYVIDNKNNPNFFKKDDESERTVGFMTSLLHDSKEKAEDKKTNGLTFLKSIFEGKFPLNELSKVLWLNSRPSSHSFYPNGTIARTFQKVKIDFDQHKTHLYNMKRGKWNDDLGDYESPTIEANSIIFHSLDNFEYIDDISSVPESDHTKKKVSFIATNERGQSVQYIFQNTNDMFKNYRSIPGAHNSQSVSVLEHIVNEYERIDLIEEVEGSSCPGIYLSRDEEKMRKFIRTQQGIEEIYPTPPDKEKLKSALQLLTQVNKVYPWEDDKFSAFVKLGLILPYGYLFKTNYNDFFPGVILYGEAGTLKSTAAELVESISVSKECMSIIKKWYITSGSELRTEFRIGRALDRHSYPVIVNECLGVFSNEDNRELIKNAISDIIVREPGGDNPYTYYSRAIPILTANNLPDSVETSGVYRRFLVLNFIESERGDIPEVIEKMQFLNENGKRNSKFKEFEVIGDFVFYTLSNHLEYFYESEQSICDKLVKAMQDYTGLDLKWLLDSQFSRYQQNDREDESQNEVEMVLKVIKKPFLDEKKRMFGRPFSDTNLLESMINNEYDFLQRVNNNQNNGILITSGFKTAFKLANPTYSKTITQRRLAELLNSQLKLDNLVFHTDNALTCTNGRRTRGVFIDWQDFCKIMGIGDSNLQSINLEAIK